MESYIEMMNGKTHRIHCGHNVGDINGKTGQPKVVHVVVAGQDPLLHYTTLCLFCLKVSLEGEKGKVPALSKTSHCRSAAVSVKKPWPRVFSAVV